MGIAYWMSLCQLKSYEDMEINGVSTLLLASLSAKGAAVEHQITLDEDTKTGTSKHFPVFTNATNHDPRSTTKSLAKESPVQVSRNFIRKRKLSNRKIVTGSYTIFAYMFLPAS